MGESHGRIKKLKVVTSAESALCKLLACFASPFIMMNGADLCWHSADMEARETKQSKKTSNNKNNNDYYYH